MIGTSVMKELVQVMDDTYLDSPFTKRGGSSFRKFPKKGGSGFSRRKGQVGKIGGSF